MSTSTALPVDIENTQHIWVYLKNLRKRLRETALQHTDMIQTSVGIIKEITDVTTALALAQTEQDQPPSKIKRLIMEFENITAEDSVLSSVEEVELSKLLADFRHLHESQLLLDSLMRFKRAKESFEELSALLSHTPCNVDNVNQTSSQSASRTLRDKIQAFNKASVNGQNILENFTNCFRYLSYGKVDVNETFENPDISSTNATSSDKNDGDIPVDEIKTVDNTE